MRYAQIRQYDVANGTGIRVSFFVTGCTHNCFNCFNKEYQDFDYGTRWTDETTEKVISMLKNPRVSGLSVLGGEPFQNTYDLLSVIKTIREHTDKSIWVWTGFLFEDLLKHRVANDLLQEIDVLVDGKFVEEKKDLTLKFRGSSNQRIIDVQKSLATNKTVLQTLEKGL